MPYISTKTSAKISPEKELVLKQKLGKAISIFPKKDESWLMLSFEDGQRMWFKGNDEPCAMINVQIFGKAEREYYDKMTAEICSIYNSELGIPKDRIYVRYDECFIWGWNDMNF